ncbi:MAG TPA: Stp1/IreP family PP2C-type Ser/Thr phosphatase [Thermoleophilaceae bacterium]|nr:Stp1/IreP family PP2C-type Ser/Thr phosphatase [Thermoleophilaceae bacterium]
MLRVVEQAGLSDVGRQRDANEDNFVIADPLFAVADGMGGAQAGEVASRAAADVFEDVTGGRDQPERLLTDLTREANRRIFEMSQTDASRRGMGTTLTAAMVWDQGVSIGHVGDSRAYRLRDGTLEQLTHDHSLVAELVRSGQLSAEAAENHPQRSIITRALGPESDVEVDAHTHTARAGDVYVLCSDGLTGMVSDPDMEAILRGAGSLDEAASALVKAANQSGGKDNITVVLFRLDEDDGQPLVSDDTLAGSETIHQGLTADDVQAAVREQERAAARAPRTDASPPPRKGLPTHARRSRGRRTLTVLASLLVAGLVVAGAYMGVRRVYFLGTDDSGLVTIYRGVPYQLPLGLDLYSERYTSSVPARSLGPARRERLLDHEWRSEADAEDLVRQLERGTLDTGVSNP